MTDDRPLARQLLDAQVDWLLAELTGPRFPDVVAQAVDDLLTAAATVSLAQLADRAFVQAIARHVVSDLAGSAVIEDLVGVLADAVHDLPASDDYPLGDLVDRETVAALVTKVLAMQQLRDRLLDRMAESPLVGTVAARFVTQIVTDFLDQNRARAEKLPGMSSVLAMGAGAASRMRGVTDQLLGDTAGRSAQYAMRRTNSAVRELARDAPLHGAALEVWDMHAAEPIGELRKYVSAEELRELALLVHRVVVDARDSTWVGDLVDACVDAIFDRYGEWDAATLLAELGVDRDVLITDTLRLAVPLLERLRADGTLADAVRTRLAPFFESPQVAALLAQ